MACLAGPNPPGSSKQPRGDDPGQDEMSVGVRHVCLDRSPLFDLPTRDARSRGFLMKNTASITLHAPRCPLLASSSARPAAALRDISTYGFVCVRVCDSKVQIAKFQVLFMASFYAVTVHKICSPQECATSISTTWMIISANSVTISRTEENMHVRGRRMWTCCTRLIPRHLSSPSEWYKQKTHP